MHGQKACSVENAQPILTKNVDVINGLINGVQSTVTLIWIGSPVNVDCLAKNCLVQCIKYKELLLTAVVYFKKVFAAGQVYVA